ncbi:MAG: hypothetical protein E7080_09385 [Bacteroidales bacterium]|nr:hypothetical protein [Bacteroidales bacterium]
MRQILLILIGVLFLFSCENKKAKPVFYDTSDSELTSMDLDVNYYSSGDVVSVPFREEGGIKFVNVSVNGVGLEMIFDTGCSSTLISLAEAEYLAKKGLLTKEDYLGNVQSYIADGSVSENMKFNLKEVVIDGKILCRDVVATVSANNNAPLLLGNEVLNRTASYTIDNENKSIIFKLK